MPIINGGDGGNILVGTDADDVIYGHSVADTLPNVGQIVATQVASGLSSPVFATSAPGDPNRLYIVEKDLGRIVLLDLSTGNRSTFLSSGVINNGDNSFAAMSNVWHVEAIGDYNGDGRDDILWRHDNGTIIDWLGTGGGGFTDNSGNLFANVALAWQVMPADAQI